jgi:IMP dehydrogenase
MFALEDKIQPQALSYGDVMLEPGASEVLPREVDLSTRIGRNIRLNLPLLSAAMDTVTEAPLAIALAREGGMGVIHKNLGIEEQAQQVQRVKRAESGVIADPVTLGPDDTVGQARQLMQSHKISGIPVVDGDGRLAGIVTRRDLHFGSDDAEKIGVVMTQDNLVTAPVGTCLAAAQEKLHRHRIEKLPLVDDDGILRGLVTVRDLQNRRQFPDACKDAEGRLRVGAALGVGTNMRQRAAALVTSGVDMVFIDSAHGHSRQVLEAVEWFKSEYGGMELAAGNIATAEAARDLVKAGADAVKVGIGPSAICTTRVVAGVGVPQVSAILACADAVAEAGAAVIADGGITQSGDLTKAIAAGAHGIMIGFLLAGTDESPGETVQYQSRTFKVYRGMGSLGAMRQGGAERYFQGDAEAAKLVPEGIEGQVPYRGSLAGVVYQLAGGLRAGMGYCGCRDLEELRRKGRFVQVSAAGVRESHPHDVAVTREAPNYWGGQH